MTLSFVLFPNKYLFNLHLLTLFSIARLFCTTTIKSFALKGHGSIAHLASPHGLVSLRATGLIVNHSSFLVNTAITLYNVDLTLKYVNETIAGDHSNERLE